MGIDIRAGFLAEQVNFDPEAAQWFRDRLKEINQVLVENGYPAHVEPEQLPKLARLACVGTARDWCWQLKRAYACFRRNKPIRRGKFSAADGDMLTDAVLDYMESHLLNHATDEGYYVPIDLPDGPLCDDRIPGRGMLGSTQGLLRELVALAPSLGLELDDGTLTSRALELLKSDLNDHPLGGELLVWHQYYEEARHSLAHGSIIVIA